MYSLDVLLPWFGTSLLFHVQFWLLLLDLYIDLLGGRSGDLYSHLFKHFPQFVVIHTVKAFDVVSKAEIDVFLELSFSMIQWMLAIWSLVVYLFSIQFEHMEVHGSCIAEAWLGKFWALLC